MAIQININTYEQLWEEITKFEKSKITFFLYFTGSKNKDGISWCSDCNAGKLQFNPTSLFLTIYHDLPIYVLNVLAKPFLEKYIGKLSSNLKILIIDVGSRDEYVKTNK